MANKKDKSEIAEKQKRLLDTSNGLLGSARLSLNPNIHTFINEKIHGMDINYLDLNFLIERHQLSKGNKIEELNERSCFNKSRFEEN